ncbi:hypothetical protein [Candidatus Nucleicultrix amoebiphila]|jgi:hypothetical protein|uniref:Uncharacterized protein n=1 Tax=Candidatus Nucleicultrix amoebiphila FS5 TaxID=1414854 RepID=A0A1W6N4V9_9PROT|nr:hypothetical protein [Candidatus Nucleicultrix amoebiphila]ARN84917.1 hypothetical protein GQ61_06045 [Candidatus Nucleicultrix amoebiphila FS5]
MNKRKFQDQQICISTFNVILLLLPIFGISFVIYTWISSSFSSLEKEITKISEQTKEINNIKSDVHAMLYNERKTQGEAVKTSSPQLASTLNSDALARYSLEQHMPSTEFNHALEILKAKPLTEAKAALKEKNLFNASQIKAIFNSEKK